MDVVEKISQSPAGNEGMDVVEAIVAGRRLGDFFDYVHAFVDAAEGGEFAIERRLRRDADEELRAIAIGLTGDADGRDHAALVFEIAELRRKLIETARAPELARRLGVLEQRVAALNDAVGHDTVEAAPIIEALAGKGDEMLYVLGRFGGRELKAEDSEVRGDDGFEVGGRLCQRGGQGKKKQGKE